MSKIRYLSSSRNPQRESEMWVDHFSIWDGPVIILGAGDGHHILEWSARKPNSDWLVLDFFAERLKPFANRGLQVDPVSAVLNCLPLEGRLILPFRPAWNGNYDQFNNLFLKLTQRAEFHLNDWMVEQGSTEELKKIWSVVRELMR